MDNITHSLVGYLVARSYPNLQAKDSQYQKAIFATTLIGSNLPDIDFLVQLMTPYNRLNYLLQHRGFTHTVLAALPFGFLAAAIGLRVGRLKGFPKKGLLSVGLISVLLHIGADYCNSYGVHPFSPFGNRWYYGDFLFILEPLIWLTCLPLVFFLSKSRLIRAGSVLIEISLLILIWVGIFNTAAVAMMLSVWAALFLLFQKKWKGPVPAIIGIFAILLIFKSESAESRHKILSIYNDRHTQIQGSQISLSPAPGNPFCWSFVVTYLDQKNGNYNVNTGVLSLWPRFTKASECDFRAGKNTQSTSAPPSYIRRGRTDILWTKEISKPIAEFQELKNQYCQFNAFLRFSRAPEWFEFNGDWFMADARFDSGNRRSFFTYKLDRKVNCNFFPAPWVPPATLLSSQEKLQFGR